MSDDTYIPNDVIGRGFSYPFHINENTGEVEDVESIDNIIKSIIHILDICLVEFPGNRAFGSGIDELVFSLNESGNDMLLQHFVIDALDRWEPRISVMGVSINRERYTEGLMEVGIDFYVLQTHEPGSMVYPFYIET